MNIGFCVTGSYCTFSKVLPLLKELVDKGHRIKPVFSYNVHSTDTRFYKARDFYLDVEEVTGVTPITTIFDAEPIGPQKDLDAMVICPATGNTLAKLNHAITDTPVLMAAKAHLRNQKPLIIAVSTNDALGGSFVNIASLMNKKNIYFVPMKQDDCIKKPNSVLADFTLVESTVLNAVNGAQIQPIFL
ncbi:MAG: dipicolinate synthase subunit B [Christensenellaceae bacterium]|jgi:dipicolinate synthase subunit B|nr:dipicolinate synthase subunit B [Christensenellaceae bacterium]